MVTPEAELEVVLIVVVAEAQTEILVIPQAVLFHPTRPAQGMAVSTASIPAGLPWAAFRMEFHEFSLDIGPPTTSVEPSLLEPASATVARRAIASQAPRTAKNVGVEETFEMMRSDCRRLTAKYPAKEPKRDFAGEAGQSPFTTVTGASNLAIILTTELTNQTSNQLSSPTDLGLDLWRVVSNVRQLRHN